MIKWKIIWFWAWSNAWPEEGAQDLDGLKESEGNGKGMLKLHEAEIARTEWRGKVWSLHKSSGVSRCRQRSREVG